LPWPSPLFRRVVGRFPAAIVQDDDDRIDIVRAVWSDQMADTERLLDAFAEASPALAPDRAVA